MQQINIVFAILNRPFEPNFFKEKKLFFSHYFKNIDFDINFNIF